MSKFTYSNVLRKTETIRRWFKNLLVIVVPLIPIGYAPMRTAPVQSHVVVWALTVAAASVYCVSYPKRASTTHYNLMLIVIGGAIGMFFSAAMFWDMIPNVGDEGKLVMFYFVGAIYSWFFVTH